MKNFFLVRHGIYDYQNRLSEEGNAQMQILGCKIRDLVNGGKVGIISSTAPRALDTVLGVESFEQDSYLWSGSDVQSRDTFYLMPDNNRVMKMIDTRKDLVDGLVLVSHLEVVRDFGRHYIQALLGVDPGKKEPAKGSAYHVDLEGRRYQVI